MVHVKLFHNPVCGLKTYAAYSLPHISCAENRECLPLLSFDHLQIRSKIVSMNTVFRYCSVSTTSQNFSQQNKVDNMCRVAQSVKCLATDVYLTANPGVASSIPVRSGPILWRRLIMKLFLRSFSSLLLIYSRRVVVSYKRKYVHELLVNRLFKPAQEKVWLGELTVPQ